MEKTLQLSLFDFSTIPKMSGVFPPTRYQGSKKKLAQWIKYWTRDLKFHTVLDAFGGTGSVAYMYKQLGKRVYYNDILKFNYYIGRALIENKNTIFTDADIDFVLRKDPRMRYPTFIQNTFKDTYFTAEENAWLDCVATNIGKLANLYKKALAYYALFQACIIKRPYNLFHRKNLYIRLAEVERSFGNKKTWDTPFEEHFKKFIELANEAVFDNRQGNRVYCADVFDLELPEKIDLVYIDTPYISKKGIGVNYLDFYHFLEGVTDYESWSEKIDKKSKHKKIVNGKDQWCDKNKITIAFQKLFGKFKDSILVVSYREDGIPSVDELVAMLKKTKMRVDVKKVDYKYVLSNGASKEVLLMAE